MNNVFEKAKKNFGFGCMRMQMDGEQVDLQEFTKMVDAFMAAGFNYFDTAHVYINGQSETALRECLTSRYPRESYVLANKLSSSCFEKNEEILPLFQTQLDACGVEYFDFYLMHCMTQKSYPKYKECGAFETVRTLKEAGKVKHLAISFHDTPEYLDLILTEQPQIEAVQIQFNYLDWENPKVQSKGCYDVCRKHNKPMIIMEPVKGGKLVNLPEEARFELDQVGTGSDASFAIRFAASFDGVEMVLSGMGNVAMVNDNISYMGDFKPLSPAEFSAIEKVRQILIEKEKIACTACRYCCEVCPQQIPIPELFSAMNENSAFAYPDGSSKAADCLECGLCEDACPQHLPIRELLKKAAEKFDR